MFLFMQAMRAVPDELLQAGRFTAIAFPQDLPLAFEAATGLSAWIGRRPRLLAALELAPDLYISHYPALELDRPFPGFLEIGDQGAC